MQLNWTARFLLDLSRPVKRVVALCIDSLLCAAAVWLAFCLRLDQWMLPPDKSQWLPIAISLCFALPIFIFMGLYRAIFRYTGATALLTLARAMGLYSILFASIFTVVGVDGVPRSIGILQPMLLLLAIGSIRIATRYWLGGTYQLQLKYEHLPKVLIYGAGASGRQIAAAIRGSEMQMVGFLDDDATLQNNTINGLTVYSPECLREVVEKLNVTDVLLALPGVGRERRNEIIAKLQPFSLRVRTVPHLMQLTSGNLDPSGRIQDLAVEDLLGRDPIAPNGILLSLNIRQKTVLVTGAGGSIGSELCRQILKMRPSKLLLVELNEYALYAIHQELSKTFASQDAANITLVPLLASAQDYVRMKDIISAWPVDTIYHAAAYKHVPLVEHNPAEGIKNNVLGTWNTARAAIEGSVSNFVLVSTDKAVRPTNVMGATKRLAEMILQGLATKSYKTRFSMVRFGNVLGSSGSVVPLFREQIRRGGPITLTHAEITRYFMTIPEAAQLVIQAGAMATGGDVFLLDMGEPMRIIDLAQRMVQLSGLRLKNETNPDGDIEIVITGLRPGEKLYEELLIGDNPEPTQHPRIMKAHEDCMEWPTLEKEMERLQDAMKQGDIIKVRKLLALLVAGYQPQGQVVDWLHLENDAAARQI
ncbi:polysaccharide biosynthesis protein [Herbaspirillum robiniae]|uniref:polysaccharide biosynthesis protein n=1 Tax=Herbaspirillum robiniae TaxID=2014887 RepID=UPI003D77AA7F